MTPTHSVHVSRNIAAPAPAVWERVSNHAETHTWVRIARVHLVTPGDPAPNGVGALREVSFPSQPLWSTITEKVTDYKAPSTFSYTITKGMPGIRGHLGTLTVEPIDAGRCTLTWHVDFEFSPWHPMRIIAGPFTRTFGKALNKALDELAGQMSKA